MVRETRLVSGIAIALASLGIALTFTPPCAATPNEADDGGQVDLSQLVKDPAFEDVLSRSFEAILTDSQRLDYLAQGATGRAAYRRRFWNRCDPTPATDANEFLEEHLRRLIYTLTHFCPYGDMRWDERGDVALRFGLPAHRAREIGDFSVVYGGLGLRPNSETWTYPDMEMSVSFIDPNLDQRYQVGFDTKDFTLRGRAPLQVDARDPSVRYQPSPGAAPIEAMQAAGRQRELEQNGQRALAEVPVSYGYSPTTEPLPFYYEIVTAMGADLMTDIAVNYQIPRNSLVLEPFGSHISTVLAKRLRVMSLDYDVITQEARTLRVLYEPEKALDEEGLLTDEWRVDARPGDYIIEFCVEETLSKRRGYGRSRVRVPSYASRRLSMSDIQLSRGVGQGRRFGRMAGSVVPHPVHAFRRDEEMIVYFELYGLTEDRPGIGRFTVQTEITGLGCEADRGWLSRVVSRIVPKRRHSVSSRIIGSGDVPDTAYWFALSLSTLPEDNYDLTVTVRDVRSKQEVSRMEAFTVLER